MTKSHSFLQNTIRNEIRLFNTLEGSYTIHLKIFTEFFKDDKYAGLFSFLFICINFILLLNL